MKVLWLVNVVMPEAAKAVGLKSMNTGGWLSGQLDMLKDESLNLQMVVCHVSQKLNEEKRIVNGNVTYVILPQNTNDLQRDFEALLLQESPDVVHIFGTEYPHSEAMIKACHGKKCVVSLQGVMVEYAKHFKDGLPKDRFNKISKIKLFVKKLYYAEIIALTEQEFNDSAKRETAMLQMVENVIGRTAWDKACAKQICPKANYYKVNENLRAEFYQSQTWQAENCKKHTIFVSQALYPIKGFHQLVKALPKIAKAYPDVKVIIGGVKPYTLNNKLLDKGVDYFFEYQSYVKKLIKQYNVSEYITYKGPLSPQQMADEFLSCNVFVSPSTIENSPNSVGEAMLLGVPIVSSNVGGVESMLTDKVDGILYDFEDIDALANNVISIFENENKAKEYGTNAREHALITHDRHNNTKDLLQVYKSVAAL